MKTSLFKLALFLSFLSISCSVNNEPTNILLSNWVELEKVTTDDLNHITFYGNNFGIVSGDFGTLLKINLAGDAINFENINIDSEFPIAHVRTFIVNQDVFYTLKHSLFKTINGGNSFTKINAGSIFDLHFFDSSIGFIIKNGRLYKTNDGGENWTEVAQVQVLSKFHFVNDNVGFIYGGITNGGPIAGGPIFSSGDILKTIDGGQTWVNLNLSVSEITALYFVDENTGYFATTEGNEIYKTSDGGIKWNLVSNDVEGSVNGIVFLNTNNGFVITHEGKIYRTNDGGNNWSVDYETTNGIYLSSITKTSDGQLFVVGGDGLMLKREG